MEELIVYSNKETITKLLGSPAKVQIYNISRFSLLTTKYEIWKIGTLNSYRKLVFIYKRNGTRPYHWSPRGGILMIFKAVLTSA